MPACIYITAYFSVITEFRECEWAKSQLTSADICHTITVSIASKFICDIYQYCIKQNLAGCCSSHWRMVDRTCASNANKLVSLPATMWGQTIAMVRACPSVCLSVCRSVTSEIDVWLLLKTRIGNRASRFKICHQIRDPKYGSAILGASGLALCPFGQEYVSWPSEWIIGNSHQSRHSTGTACFVV